MSEDSLSRMTASVARVSDIYAERFQIERDPAWYLAKLSEELGELVAVDLKLSGKARQHGKSEQELQRDLEREAGDLFAHLLLYCQNRGIDLEAAMKAKWYAHLSGAK